MAIPNQIASTKLPFRFVCPEWDCYWACSFMSQEELEYWTIHHPCSVNGRNYMTDVTDENGQPYTKPWHGPTVAEKVWDRLDIVIELIMSNQDNSDTMKGQGQALAFVLHTMYDFHYPDIKDVTREAVRRYKQKQGLVEFAPTPGYKYNPIPPGTPLYAAVMKEMSTPAPRPRRAASTTKTTTTATLSEEHKTAIRKGLAMQFEPQQLALAYGVTVEVVESLRE